MFIKPRGGSWWLLNLLFHIPNFLRLGFRLLKDKRVGIHAKAVMIAALAYTFIPSDLLPDFLVALGLLDDIIVLLMGYRIFLALCPKDVVAEHAREIDRSSSWMIR
jgi:uncharacterized membrane protein YkvA (DUF1232 family)